MIVIEQSCILVLSVDFIFNYDQFGVFIQQSTEYYRVVFGTARAPDTVEIGYTGVSFIGSLNRRNDEIPQRTKY